MSLTSSADVGWNAQHSAEGSKCFYCGSPVHDPAIVWSGYTGLIWFHPRCALDFIVRLTRDVHEWQCTTGRTRVLDFKWPQTGR